jgi:hypothetical protein
MPESPQPVVSHSGETVPLQMLAKMNTTWGAGVINSEDARPGGIIKCDSTGGRID